MVEKELLHLLACPWCLGALQLSTEGKTERLDCQRCGARYRVEDDIPNMLVSEAEIPCPLCHEIMENRQGSTAVCRRCGRRFDLTRRITGSPLAHAELFCPLCGGRVTLDKGYATCSSCGKQYPVENGVAMTLPERAL